MSWNSYIDNLLGHTAGHGDLAAIIGLDGSAWTDHSHAKAMKITPTEAQKIGAAMKAGDYSGLQASGIYIEGVKYNFLREMDSIILGKKKDCGAVTLQKTKTAVVICHVKEGSSQGNVNKGVATIAEYLESLGM